MSAASEITDADVYGRIRRAISLAGSQKAFAEGLGVTPAFVNQVLNAKRPVPDAMLRRVGLKRVTRYVETNVR